MPGIDDGPMPGRTFEVAIDANDPELLRRFWMVMLDYVERTTAEGAVDFVDPVGRVPRSGSSVPEGKMDEPRTGVR